METAKELPAQGREAKGKRARPDKGERKGWPLISEARHRRLSEARSVLIYDPVTKETTHAEW